METVEKKFTNIKKRNLTITYEDIQHILDKMLIGNILHESGNGISSTYLIPQDPDKNLLPVHKVIRVTQIIFC